MILKLFYCQVSRALKIRSWTRTANRNSAGLRLIKVVLDSVKILIYTQLGMTGCQESSFPENINIDSINSICYYETYRMLGIKPYNYMNEHTSYYFHFSSFSPLLRDDVNIIDLCLAMDL